MEFSVEKTGDLGRKLTVTIPSEEIETKVSGRFSELGKNVRLKGFRPGKVPARVIEQRFGRQVRQEVVGDLIQKGFEQAVSEEKLRPATRPEIDFDLPPPQSDMSFTASFEVLPELEDIDVSGLAIEKPVAEVTDADVDAMVETLREQRRQWETVERAAEEGDLAFFRFSADYDGGRFPENEDDHRAGAVLGRGGFDAEFERALIGLSAGEDKSFDLTFSEQARETALAGKAAKVSVHVEKVQESVLPELNDAFFAAFGVEGGEAKFREEVRGNMQRELKAMLTRRLRNDTLKALNESYSSLELPAGLVEQEAEDLRQRALKRAAEHGIAESEVPAADEFREQAEQRVRSMILVGEIARLGEIKIDGGRVRDLVNDVASTYEDSEAVAAMYYNNPNMLASMQNVVLEEQVVEWVLERAAVTEKSMSFDEIMHPERDAAA